MIISPVALVTGANKGLGKETARQLALQGLTVLLGSRDPERGTQAARELAERGTEVTPVRIDVTDPEAIADAAKRIDQDYGRLDVLVNNAGTITEAPTSAMTAAQLRETYDVNVFGVVSTINALLPLLRRSQAPRIVNVSSTTASLTLTCDGTDFGGDAHLRAAYSSSKTALNMLTIQYAIEFAKDPQLSHIKINSATPGYVATDMTRHRGVRSVDQGARVIVDLATLPGEGPTGGFFNDRGPVPW